MRGRVGRYELAIDNKNKVELGLFGQLGLLGVPPDIDTGVAGDLGVEPPVVVPWSPYTGDNCTELDLSFGHWVSSYFVRRAGSRAAPGQVWPIPVAAASVRPTGLDPGERGLGGAGLGQGERATGREHARPWA